MDTLEELGKKAYQKQIWGEYEDAINIYNKAIGKYPRDPRLLNNRCLCYIEVKDFIRALEDAELMISLFPKHAKSYYRKGEVLTVMKRFLEAEELFRKVLALDTDCEEARRQLLHVQAMQLCQRGHNKDKALKALTLTLKDGINTASVEKAEIYLKFGAVDIYEQSVEKDSDNVYYSDDESTTNTYIKQDMGGVYDPLTDPSNPLKSCSLWVGFVTEAVNEKMLKDLFSKYGKILSVFVYHPNHCAFINYSDPVSPGRAMHALQGKLVGGRNILIKFPDSAANQTYKRTKAL